MPDASRICTQKQICIKKQSRYPKHSHPVARHAQQIKL